jgi:hypothetical protein
MASVTRPVSPPTVSTEPLPRQVITEMRKAERQKLRTSRFDSVTSFFMALILFIGTFVFMLFIVWLTSRWSFPPRPIEPIIENPAGRGDNAEGFERDFEPPGAEEVEELMEPTLQDTIEAVTDAVSSVAASLVTADTSASATTEGSGKGDSRPPGPEGEGEDIVPRFQRWQLDFTARDVTAYARQLDFFQIEPGAIGGSIQGVDVCNQLVAGPQKYRIVDTESEKRLYFMWTSPSPLMQFDQQLLQQAGIPFAGRQILKFIPKDLEDRTLANLERDYYLSKGYKSVVQVAKTVFECKADGGGYKFEVTSQRYRKGK